MGAQTENLPRKRQRPAPKSSRARPEMGKRHSLRSHYGLHCSGIWSKQSPLPLRSFSLSNGSFEGPNAPSLCWLSCISAVLLASKSDHQAPLVRFFEAACPRAFGQSLRSGQPKTAGQLAWTSKMRERYSDADRVRHKRPIAAQARRLCMSRATRMHMGLSLGSPQNRRSSCDSVLKSPASCRSKALAMG